MWTVACILQSLDEECQPSVVVLISSKFSDAIGCSAIGKLIGYRQHLIGLQGCFQGDIAQSTVQRIFRRVQKSGSSQFLIVLTTCEGSI